MLESSQNVNGSTARNGEASAR